MTQEFKDHIVQHPNRYKQTTVAPGIVELTPTWVENPNEVVQLGTPVDRQLINGITSQLADIETETKKLKESNANVKKGYITIIDDDGNTDFLTKLKPVFDAKGIKCDIAINPGNIGITRKMTWAQLLQLKSEGYGLLNHGYKHQTPLTFTDEQLAANYELEKAEFIANGLDTYDYYVYPGTQPLGDAALKNKLKKFYKCSYGNADRFSGQSIPFDNYDIKREAIYATASTVTSYIDRMMDQNGYCVLFGHSQDVGYTTEKLTVILDHIIANGYEVISAKDMIDKFANVIELGDSPNEKQFLVDRNGNTSFDTMIDHSIIDKPSDYNQSISNYLPNSKTTFIATGVTSYAEDVFKIGGIVTTYRFADDRFSYQTATYINSEKVLLRHWDNTNGVWLPFVEVNKPGILFVPLTTQYNAAWVITDFETNRLTIHEIGYTPATSMGLPETGTIKTYRFGSGRERYAYQEYERFDKVEQWVRRWNATTSTWRPWVKVFGEV